MLFKSVDILYSNNPDLYLDKDGNREAILNLIKERLSAFFSKIPHQYIACQDLNERPKNIHEKKLILAIPIYNPLIDLDILEKMIEKAILHKCRVVSQGEVPGTAPLYVMLNDSVDTVKRICYSNKNRKYNTQLNLRRGKRIKVFRSLLKKFENLSSMSIEELMVFFSSREGVELVLKYGTEVDLHYYTNCPHCKSENFNPLYLDSGHPVCGFLTKDAVYYYLCEECHLVFLNPRMPEGELWRYYDSYAYEVDPTVRLADKFELLTLQNTSHLENYKSIIRHLEKLSTKASILDLGGGNGEFAVFCRQLFPEMNISVIDYRIDEELKIELSKRNIYAAQMNFLKENIEKQKYDLITSWEVMEHIPVERFDFYINQIFQALRPGGQFIFSTPDFNSSYCQVLDFWAMAPGEHLTVLSRKFLEPLLKKHSLIITDELHECVVMKNHDRWFLYGETHFAGNANKGALSIINNFLRDEKNMSLHRENFMRANNLGSELILCTQKLE